MNDISNNQCETNHLAGGCESALTSEQTATNLAHKTSGEQNQNAVSLGKFNSVQALLSAYNNLEGEFTKRSQQLKSLERENLSLKQEQTKSSGGLATMDCQSFGADDETGIATKEATENSASSLTGNSENHTASEVSNFLKNNPSAVNYAEEIAQKTSELIKDNQNIDANLLSRAYVEVLRDLLTAEKSKVTDDFIYSKASESLQVRQKIIRDYLSDLAGNKSASLLSVSGSSVVMPPKKPATISEAGAMATKVLKQKS